MVLLFNRLIGYPQLINKTICSYGFIAKWVNC